VGFNAGSGTVLADSSGHAIDGTVAGTAFRVGRGRALPDAGQYAAGGGCRRGDNARRTPRRLVAVVSNDTDADCDVLTVTASDPALHGTTALGANGSITYTPAANYQGPDTFTYTLNDNQGGVSNRHRIDDRDAGQRRTGRGSIDAYAATEDLSLTIAAPGVLGNDTDIDLEALSRRPRHGARPRDADAQRRRELHLHAGGQLSRQRQLYLTAPRTRATQSNLATVTITVTDTNDAPAGAADAYAATERRHADGRGPRGVLANDTDPDGDTMSVLPLASPAHGSLTLSADGSLVYTPAPNFNGRRHLHLHRDRRDPGSRPPVTVTITVAAVNDSPAAANDTAATAEDTPVTIAVLGNDSDLDGDTLVVSSVGAALHGGAVNQSRRDDDLHPGGQLQRDRQLQLHDR